jgi:hypothetical protein
MIFGRVGQIVRRPLWAMLFRSKSELLSELLDHLFGISVPVIISVRLTGMSSWSWHLSTPVVELPRLYSFPIQAESGAPN